MWTITYMHYLGHILMSFPRLDLSEVSYMGLESPRHTRILSSPVLLILAPNPVFAISYSYKKAISSPSWDTVEVRGCSWQRPQADGQICTNVTTAQKSGIFSSLLDRFYYLSRVLLSTLCSQALFISTLDKGSGSQTYAEEEEVTMYTGVKEGLTQPLSLLMCGTLQGWAFSSHDRIKVSSVPVAV